MKISDMKKSDATKVTNPYVIGSEGRKEWNDRYMNMSKGIRSWQIACIVIACIAFGELFVISKMSSESKIKPYVVETNQGVPYAMKPVKDLDEKDTLIINYAVNQFVINAKSIIADATALKSMLDKVYAYSSGNTLGFLQDYYSKNNPFDLAARFTVSINIINILPVSKNTWEVNWQETKRNVNGGSVVSITKWVGHFTTSFGKVNEQYINDNPFGLYITDVSWSQSQQ
jgi:type IV secretion system protein VirB5